MEKLLISTTEAAHALSISRPHLYTFLDSGELASISLGKRRLIPVVALREWVDKRQAQAREDSTRFSGHILGR